MTLTTNLLTGLKEEQNIKVRSTAGWIISITTLLSALNSTYVFLFFLKTGIDGWLFLNSCAISIFVFFAGYIFKSPLAMTISTAFMFRYGTLGLFFFSWSGVNLIAQAGHILMTLSVAYTVFLLIKEKAYRTLIAGITAGLVVLLIFELGFQQPWFNARPGLLDQLFAGQY